MPTDAPESQAPGRRDWAIYKRLLGYVRDQKAWFALAAGGFLLTAGGEAGFAWTFGLVIDGLAYPMPSYLWVFPALMLALALPRALGAMLGDYALSRVSFAAIHVIRTQLFDRLLYLPSAFYDGSAQGHLVSRLTFTTAQLRDTTTDALKVLVADGLKVVVFLAFLLLQNAVLTLSFAVIAPLVGVIVRFASRRFRRLSVRIQGSMGDVTHVASEAVAGYREIKIFGGEAYEQERFRAASEGNRRQNLKMAVTKAASSQVIQFLAAAAIAALVCLIFLPGIGGTMSPGELAAYLGIAGALANPIKKLSDVNARLQRGLAAAEELFEQLDETPERDTGDLDVARVAGEIRLEGVGFGYDAERAPVLRDVSLTIRPGETLALVGRSGAGKTTLASLIARFYEPSAGQILLDGEPLTRYRLSCLRRQIALVTQEVTLFNDTLANNVAYGALAGAAPDAVATALARAHAEEFAAALPEGLDTRVGDDGVLLSGGQRQRVAIARALLKDAPILILDEATSALDAVSEREVQAALTEVMRGRTTIVIAHRLSTVERADVIAVVEEGRIVELGNHATLIDAGGAYAELYRSQFAAAESASASPPEPPPAPVPAVARGHGALVAAWHQRGLWQRLLWPLAALFAWVANRRRRRFLAGRSRTWQAPVPVVVVGNLSVGGTGKTPIVVWLAQWLGKRGIRAGVVSRGYGGKGPYPLRVTADTPARQCGDEAALIARRTGCPVVVDPNRPRAVRTLLANAAVDVVLADDGLQHYPLGRDIEIAVVDGHRGLGNGLCLPAGPLREPRARLAEYDWVVANGRATGLVADESVAVAEATAVVNIVSGERLSPAAFLAKHGAPLAVAGIGNPARFEETLAAAGINVAVRGLPDHHRFSAADLTAPPGTPVLMTEKDAQKVKALGDVAHCWYLEIAMRFLEPVDERLTELFAAHGIAVPPPDAPTGDAPAATPPAPRAAA